MKSKPISNYFDEALGVTVQVYATKKARKEERTFINRAGSVFLLGRRVASLRDKGIYASCGAA